MKRRGFGFVEKGRAQLSQIRSGSQELQRQQQERDAEAAGIEIKRTDDRVPTWRDRTPLGYDDDSFAADLRKARIANPHSAEYQASTSYAARRAAEHKWDAVTERIYAIYLRSVDLPRSRPSSVAVVDRDRREQVNVPIMTTGPGQPMDGRAWFIPSTIDPYVVLDLPPQPPPPMTYSLTQGPRALTGLQRAEAARLMEHANAQLEASGYLEWHDRGSRGLLRL